MLKEYEIPMDNEVAAELNKISKTSFLSKDSLKLIWEVVPLGGTTIALVLVLIWIFINWLLGFIITFDFGWNSQYRNYILWPIVGLSYSWLFFEVAKTCGPNSQTKQALKKDLEVKVLKVSEYPIYEVKFFEEPEHGGFIYFVRTSGDKVLALFDSESQDLSIDDQDPKDSSYKIRNVLKISKAPNSNIIVGEQFSGEPVQIPELEVFTANTKIWPKHADFVKCKWENISAKYVAKSTKST
jgi:hypothetical protein